MSFNHLKKIVFQEAEKKQIPLTDEYLDRINFETSIIEEKNLAEYFMIAYRLMEVAKEMNLMVQPYGLFSDSSIVSYCMGFGAENPFKNGIPADNFIEIEKDETPAFHLSLSKDKSTEVYKQFLKKYPVYKLTHLQTPYDNLERFGGPYKKPGLIRNLLAFNHDKSYAAIQGKNFSKKCFKRNGEPVFPIKETQGKVQYPYFKVSKDELLLKFHLITNEIGEVYHPDKIQLSDPNVFDFISSSGFKKTEFYYWNNEMLGSLCLCFKPRSIKDLAFLFSMGTPGLYDYGEEILHRYDKLEPEFDYSDWIIKDILEETYGLPIYSNQFARILHRALRIPCNEAYKLEKSMVYKDEKGKEEFFEDFEQKCLLNTNLKAEEAQFLNLFFQDFADSLYSSNEAEKIALTIYRDIWYKVHFPEVYNYVSEKRNAEQFQ